MIDDDWASTELIEANTADDETDALLAVATFRVTVIASSASLLSELLAADFNAGTRPGAAAGFVARTEMLVENFVPFQVSSVP